MVIISFCKVTGNEIIEKETAVQDYEAKKVKDVLLKYGYCILSEERV